MKYIATAVLKFGMGAVLGLSEVQAAARAHFLAPLQDRKGWYITTASVQFKSGEEIQYESDLPKNLAEKLEVQEKPAAKQSVKGKARAAAIVSTGGNEQGSPSISTPTAHTDSVSGGSDSESSSIADTTLMPAVTLPTDGNADDQTGQE